MAYMVSVCRGVEISLLTQIRGIFIIILMTVLFVSATRTVQIRCLYVSSRYGMHIRNDSSNTSTYLLDVYAAMETGSSKR